MKRRHQSFNSFPKLDTFIEVFIVLAIIYGIPYFLGYYGCQILFDGSPEDCKTWGSLIMIGTPIACYLLDRLLSVFGINLDKN